MQEVIKKIYDGEYNIGSRSLNFSCSKIEIAVSSDCDFEGSFHIYCEPGTETDGFVTSSDCRMECINYAVSGSDTEVSYHFHGDLSKPGDVIKGAFCIVSNQGEYFLPFVVNIERPLLYSSQGAIRNLSEYANFAKSNWEEAVNLFYSSEFKYIFEGDDENFFDIYNTLDDCSGNEQNVEEFLISVGKKNCVEYLYTKKSLQINLMARDLSSNIVEKEIEIVRNGWGYTQAKINIQGDFLFSEKSSISETDFLGNVCILKIFIDPRLCANGIHTGNVIVESPFGKLEIPVEVKSKSTTIRVGKQIIRTRKNAMYQITRDYVYHSLGLIDDEEWIKNTGKAAESMAAMDDMDFYAKLYQARILILENRMNEAAWLVDRAGELIEKTKHEKKMSEEMLAAPICYHWLLVALVKDEPAIWKKAAEKVESIYKRNKSNWEVGIVCLNLPTSYNANILSRWNMLEYLYNAGARSPILYATAINLVNENATVLRQLNGFGMQIVSCGAKYNAFNQASLLQIVFLAGRIREYNRGFLNSLIRFYNKTEDKNFLQEICSQLIKGRRQDKKAFEWYEKAVLEDIRLTNLYEYYVFSIDTNIGVQIPKSILMYFSYQNSLDYERMAYIYHYIIAFKEQYPDIYENNVKNMEDFAIAQVRKNHINRDLAVIYDEFLDPKDIDGAVASGMSDILFAHIITCNNAACNKVYVYQKGCTKPWEYDLKDGTGYISIYGNGYSIAFGDTNGNVYLGSADYKLEKILNAGKYMSTVSEFVWDNTRFNMYLIGVGQEASIHVTPENIKRFIQISESPEVSKEIRLEMLLKAMEFYRGREDIRELGRCFGKLKLEDLNLHQRQQVFEYLMILEQYDVILDWLRKYGPFFADTENMRNYLEKIITPRADKKEKKPEEAITNAAIYVFKGGNPGSVITEYLAKYYRGMSTELRDIWKALVLYELPKNDLEEKLLIQVLYTGAFLPEKYEIASDYIKNNPKSRLTKALIVQLSYEYFAGKGKIDDRLMEIISKYASPDANLPRPTQLAFLKYYSEYPDKLNNGLRLQALGFLKKQIEEGVYLGFFKNYLNVGMFTEPDQIKKAELVLEKIAHLTIIDYQVKPGKVARINYMLTQDDGEQGEYYSEYMRDVCGGVCFKDFILFFGEKLQYYITEEDGEYANLSKSGTLQINEIGMHGPSSRYDMINDLLCSDTMKDYERFDSLLEDYFKHEFMNKELFRLE